VGRSVGSHGHPRFVTLSCGTYLTGCRQNLHRSKTATMAAPPIGVLPDGRDIHYGIICDMCRCGPILGDRYNNKKRPCDDFCHRCFQGLSTKQQDRFYQVSHQGEPYRRASTISIASNCICANACHGCMIMRGLSRAGPSCPLPRRLATCTESLPAFQHMQRMFVRSNNICIFRLDSCRSASRAQTGG